MDTLLIWMSTLTVAALLVLLLWELEALRAAQRNADRRERRQAAVRAQQLRTPPADQAER
ncbi:hypothetical protein ABZW47_29535 [Streptomyces sp. NPDC004549]|uniref:hypothetical protein n=1 Tax=Streptomyces sp. NPDC004549 TaxID=3154283 RepID=UPI0033BBAA2C